MEPDNVLDLVKEQIKPILDNLGAEIIEVAFKRAGKNPVLRLIVDKDGGITIGECASINKQIGDIIEKNTLIAEQYLIEVSSPGLDRPLKTKKDFERIKGKEADFWLSAPLEGSNFLSGTIKEAYEDNVTIAIKDGKEAPIPYTAIAKAKLHIEL